MDSKNNKTWADVAYALIEFLNKLFNKGGLFNLIVVVFLFIAAMMAVRLPSEDIVPSIGFLLSLFSTTGFVIVAILLNNAVWIVLYKRNSGIMQKEIDRLCEERRNYLHGGKLIENHVSSSDALERPSVVVKAPLFEQKDEESE